MKTFKFIYEFSGMILIGLYSKSIKGDAKSIYKTSRLKTSFICNIL